MRCPVDLHVHTNASDGELSPAELVGVAVQFGLQVIGITDHDTTAGINDAVAAAASAGLTVVPGLEISTDIPGSEVHVLGYHIDIDAPQLREKLSLFRDSRLNRARGMTEKLGSLGLHLDWERIEEIADGAVIGRPHIAQALQERGYVSTIGEAFDRYIGRNGPAYVERYKMTPAEAVQTILASGGVPVLAHPLQILHVVPGLVQAGLAGLECYYTGYTSDDVQLLVGLAERYGLVATGGSDFHGELVQPDNFLGGVVVPFSAVEGLQQRHQMVKTGSRA